MSVSFSSSLPPKLSVSITTDQLGHSGLIAVDTDGLGGREPENETKNFGRFSPGRSDGRLEVYHKYINIMYIFYDQNVDRVHGRFIQYAGFYVLGGGYVL